MARTNLHTLVEVLTGPLQIWSSTFSGAATLVSPDTGKHLRVYDVVASVANDGDDTEIQLRDGSAAASAHWFLGAGRERKLSLNGHFWPVGTNLQVVRPNGDHKVTVTVYYKERLIEHV